jgi:multidrug efflux pump subunit AcrA (membrane-fusion protein)
MSTDKPRFFTGQLVALVIFVLAVFGGLFAIGMLPRRERVAAITQQAREEATDAPTVTVTLAAAAPPSRDIVLPATSSAIMDTPVYARAEGYLVKLRADIGDRVKKGQVLVELDTPELDQQLASSEARLAQIAASQRQLAAAEREAAAGVKLAAVTAERWKRLVAEGVFSKTGRRRQGGDAGGTAGGVGVGPRRHRRGARDRTRSGGGSGAPAGTV